LEVLELSGRICFVVPVMRKHQHPTFYKPDALHVAQPTISGLLLIKEILIN